jgi:regulator of protease activity HflC (stomatin/prohibitin superfamily)
VDSISPALIVAIVFALFVIILVARSVRIIPQAHAGIVERLGRYSRTLDPGLHVLVPFVETLKPLVDMREQVVTFPPQPVITQDNVTISIDTVFYFQVTDPFRATYEVADLILAVEQLTVTTLRNVIGSLSLEEVLTSRDKINADLRIVLDEATERWGIRVARIELKSIDPPASIQEAMEKQMRAERDKRAAILSAEGEKQSAILTAEGARQSAILRAEADQKSQILRAEGDKQAAILRATGEAEAIRQLFQSIHEGNPTPDLLAYKYLEALPKLAEGQSTKLMFIPSDAMQALGGVAAMGSAFQMAQDAAATTAPGVGAPPPPPARRTPPRRIEGDGNTVQ